MITPGRVRAVTRAILFLGLTGAAAIYVANAGPSGPQADDLEESKMYLHDLEVYGGRANVLASDFRHWFTGLWQGRNLAFTVAVLTVLAALAWRFFATPLPPRAGSGGPDGVSASGGTSARNRPSRP
ncbi:MAG TPA: hypothetical protein VMN04_15260 [Thermoanaerobaculia bacterium]|nr:hypothetical protein [Thermoanaerobaculia bacterium]